MCERTRKQGHDRKDDFKAATGHDDSADEVARGATGSEGPGAKQPEDIEDSGTDEET